MDVLWRQGCREVVDTASLHALVAGTGLSAAMALQLLPQGSVCWAHLQALQSWLGDHLTEVADAELEAEAELGEWSERESHDPGTRSPVALPPEVCRYEPLRFGRQAISWLADALGGCTEVLHQEVDVSGEGYLLVWNEVQRARPWRFEYPAPGIPVSWVEASGG